tara:strand:+ start:1279 stop:2085 length:807 start_codon:yes stop_codon:yes gene_type:complete
MNIILERWKGFLKEETDAQEEIGEHNSQFIFNLLGQHSSWNRKLKSFISQPEDYNNDSASLDIILGTPLENEHKIVKVLGAGTMGVVFEIDNGHALKLYKDGYRRKAGKREEDFYANESGKIFSGLGSIRTLPIFDQGENRYGVKYVEMAKVIPFNKFIEMTGRVVPRGPFFREMQKVGLWTSWINADRSSRRQNKQMAQEYVSKFTKIARKQGLTKYEIESILKMAEYIAKNYGEDYLDDIDAPNSNFGVLEQTATTKYPQFVLFDP